MDNSTPPALPERNPVPSSLNGGGSHARRPSPGPGPPLSPVHTGGGTRPSSLLDGSVAQGYGYSMVQVVVTKDEKGYGMKVSGDNPVYVQSVKEGGAAEKAGLHAGDKIIKVNGVNVKSSTHTQVVALIRAQTQVVLTVQQRTSLRHSQGSPSMHNRLSTTPTSQRITGPQPVDNEKQFQLQREKENYYRLMIEKEKHWMDVLRSQIATSPDEKKMAELEKTKKNIETLEAYLHRSLSEQSPSKSDTHIPIRSSSISSPVSPWSPTSPNGNTDPPPLPKRNQNTHKKHFNTIPAASSGRTQLKAGGVTSTPASPIDVNMTFINNEINANHTPTPRRRNMPHSHSDPPPLPPRTNLLSSPMDPDAVNSINKQMSYPLVATFATLVNDYSPSHHQRTKSSPESLSALSVGAEASKKLIASESMSDLCRQDGGGNWERADTPPGTPPPPYPSPLPHRRDEAFSFNAETSVDGSPEFGAFRPPISRVLANSSPIHAANTQLTQQPIISMEDDEISDLEINQVEDHGHFKSLSRLWEHLPHLAVFMNYILSNSDPNSLLFYLLTDLYKEGNAKEMRKWAFEIHSCFLVPGAPLRLSNVDENIAREIDEVLTKEFDKEEILRKIFWKARSRAKEELTRQLADFQQKRIAGLGTIFGPADQQLLELYHDKSKEIKLYESLFLEKLDPYLEEIEKDSYDPKRYYTAAALTTVLTRIFQIRPSHAFEKCPTFVNKEKSFRFQFLGRYTRKWNILNHQFLAQHYFTVIPCYYCHQIIYGIGPQGYQCTACHVHLHRTCVKLYDDTCPGPVTKKDKFRFRRMRQEGNSDHRRKQSAIFLHTEKENRQMEEKDSSFDHSESGDSNRTGQPVSRSGSDRRPDAVREERHQQEAAGAVDPMNDSLIADSITPDSGERIPPTKRKSTNVNRSESVKEQSEKRKQQRRNISDPSHNNTPSADVDIDTPQSGLSNPDSSSSSNCSLSNGRLSDSPSNSVDTVQGRHHQHNKTDSDSESGFESDIPMWQNLVPEDQRKNLTPQEQKRQDIINELFSTENSHVRSLRVLYKIFYERLKNSQQLKPDEMSLIFPNIKDLFEVHNDFNKRMKKRRNEQPLIREVGDIVLHMFDSDLGLELKKAAAKFCEKQHIALQMIQDRRKKDSKFNDLLTECEKKRHCRRLPFQGFLPAEMQRLSKYPLLLERLLGNVEDKSNEETAKLQRALQKSREILNFVNESIREASNRHRLEEIQKHLDITNFKGDHPILRDAPSITDVTSHKLIREGSMLLKRPNKGPVPVHILLMEEAVYILQKEGDRFLLKFFQSGSVSNTLPLSPYIKTSLLLVRNNAVCKNGLYLVNTHTNNSQIYDLVAEDDTQRDLWLKHFEKAVENHCKKDGKMKNTPASDLDTEEIVQDLHTNDVQPERAEQVEQEADKEDEGHEKTDEDKPVNDGENHERDTTKSPETVSGGGNGILRTSKITAEEWPLIQPSQVQVEVPPVHTAESMLTPLEQIKRKDNIVMQALEDKQSLIADLLNIPREDFAHIADMASTENTSTREPSDRVMAAIYQTNQLLQLLNESLNISESDAVIARGGKSPACASQKDLASNNALKPSVPVDAVQNLVQPLSRQLNALLDEVKQMEDERDRLRRETAKMRERLHEQHNLHGPEPAEAISSEETGEDLGSTQESLRKPEDSETAE